MNQPFNLIDLYEIAGKIDPDYLYVLPKSGDTDPDRVLLYPRDELLQKYPDEKFPKWIHKPVSILKLYTEKSGNTIRVTLDNETVARLKLYPEAKPYMTDMRVYTDRPLTDIRGLPLYKLVKDEKGNSLPDIPRNRLPSDVIMLIYRLCSEK